MPYLRIEKLCNFSYNEVEIFGQRFWAYSHKRTRGHDILAVLSFHVEAIIIMTYCGDKTKKED